MKISRLFVFPLLLVSLAFTTGVPLQKTGSAKGKPLTENAVSACKIVTGAEQTRRYLPWLKGKKVAMTINQTSTIGQKLSMDTLLSLGVNVVKGFGPEHGFRGNASDGAGVANFKDPKTGIPIISLYGNHNKPTPDELAGVEVMIFDIQDVGARFYTFLSTLHYVMEACAENKIELIVLDRPNPNGGYVDGPVMEDTFKSFVGLHPVPIVYGLTIGEYARMINGEGWLKGGIQCNLKVVSLQNYRHDKAYTLPIPPSPNLNSQQSILLYPSLCLFEGTVISQGRGTQIPFQVLGNPAFKGKYPFSFTPVSIKGMSDAPPLMNKACFGIDLRGYDSQIFQKCGRINLSWLLEFYNSYPDKEQFFLKNKNGTYGFDRLAGTDQLRLQIIAGKSEKEIRESWEPKLSKYKALRKKYLLYP